MLLTLLLLISFPRVMYVAIQPIQKGSEIVIDYGDEFWKVRTALHTAPRNGPCTTIALTGVSILLWIDVPRTV